MLSAENLENTEVYKEKHPLLYQVNYFQGGKKGIILYLLLYHLLFPLSNVL